jgi:hypothetical protein
MCLLSTSGGTRYVQLVRRGGGGGGSSGRRGGVPGAGSTARRLAAAQHARREQAGRRPRSAAARRHPRRRQANGGGGDVALLRKQLMWSDIARFRRPGGQGSPRGSTRAPRPVPAPQPRPQSPAAQHSTRGQPAALAPPPSSLLFTRRCGPAARRSGARDAHRLRGAELVLHPLRVRRERLRGRLRGGGGVA